MENIEIKIGADTKELVSSISEIAEKTTGLGSILHGVGGPAIAAFTAMSAAVVASVAAYREEELIAIRVNNALSATGGIAGVTKEQVEGLAEALGESTINSKAQVKEAEAVLLTFTRIGKDVFPEATKAALDLAAGMRTDTTSAAQILGRALQNPIEGLRALRRAHIDVTTSEKEHIEAMILSGDRAGAQAAVLDLVKSEFEGQAAAMKGGTGEIVKFGQVMKELTADIGSIFVPGLTYLAKGISGIIHSARDAANSISSFLGNQVKKEVGNTLAIVKDAGERTTATVTSQARDRAKRLQDEEDNRFRLLAASEKAGQAAQVLSFQHASSELIKLEQEKSKTFKALADDRNSAIRGALQAHLKEVNALEAKAESDQNKRRQAFDKLQIKEGVKFNAAEKAELISHIKTEEQAMREFEAKRLELKIESDNQFLLEQQRFGTLYATLNQVMHSEVIEGTNKAFGEMAQMTQSQNATLKAIGKAAALYNIGIKTIESAENVYAGFATIPIIGQALGIAGAAAAVAFGAENAAKVAAMAQGGLVTGGIPGVDSVPMLAQEGELVVPRQNFKEVVRDAASRLRGGGQGGGETRFHHTFEIKGDLARYIQVKTVRDTALGIKRS